MPAIKSASDIAAKWSRVTPQRASDYTDGVKTTTKSWANNTKDAEDSYELGIQNSIQAKSYGKGVEKAGDAKWKRKTTELGGTRWGPGVRAASGDYQAGFAPYREVIQNTVLPQRYPKGDPRNYERVMKMGEALHAAKVA